MTAGRGSGAFLEWQDYRSAHFDFSFLPDSEIEKNITAFASRLEAVRTAGLKVLDLEDLPEERVRVYLLSQVPGGRSGEGRGDQVFGAEGRQVLAVYLSDNPARALEHALVELLLIHGVGARADQPAMLVDGVLGYVAQQIDGSDPIELVGQDGEPSLAGVLRGRPAGAAPLYYQIVTSFVAFLLTTYGAESFKRFAQRFDPDLPDRASEAAYGKTMAALEEEWIAALRRSRPGSSVPLAPGTVYRKQISTPEEERLVALQRTQPPETLPGPPAEPDRPPGPGQAPTPGVMAFLRGAVAYLRPYWGQEALILLATAIGAAFTVVLPLAFGQVIDALRAEGDYSYLWPIVIGVVALFLLQVPALLGQEYLSARVGANVMNDIQYRMFEHLQRLSADFYFRTKPGDISSRFTNDLALVNMALTQMLPMLATLTITFVGSLITLFFLQGWLALIVVVVLPFFFILPARFGARAANATRVTQENRALVNSTLQESINAQQVIKAYSLQRLTVNRFWDQLRQLGRSAIRGGFLSSLPGTTANLSVAFIQVVALAGGSLFVIYGGLGVGALVSFQLLLGGVTGPIMSLTSVWQMLLQASVGMQRVDELLEERPQVQDAPDARALGPFSRDIRFENVSFSYTGEQVNLRDVNLAIPAGQSIAFVGPSGSGKSTILNLIMRFYDPTSGAVTVDGQDLRGVTQESLRDQVGIVFQDTFLYNASVRENITLGKLDATEDEIEAAARAAEIHDFILTLPQGYETPVGERGGQLSGGQRQRIAIARAILYDPKILVLDEPTSALDPQTEAAVNATLRRQGQGRTVVTVTHRLASVVSVDRIFVLERGQIAEQGTHEELLSARGLYYRLWGQQNGFEDAPRVGVEASRLRAIPFFEDLDENLLTTLANRFVKEHHDEGRTVFEEGDPGDTMYFIDRGEVEVVGTGPAGEERRVALLRDGDYFGEIALLEDVPRTATIRTRASTSLLALNREEFLGLLRAVPSLRAAFERGVEVRRRANLAALRETARVSG